MTSRPPYPEVEQQPGLVGTDVDATADLQDEETADQIPSSANEKSCSSDSVSLHEVDVTPAASLEHELPKDASTSDLRTTNDLPLALMPTQRAWGFLIFAVCTLLAMLFSARWDGTSSPVRTEETIAARSVAAEAPLRAVRAAMVDYSVEKERPAVPNKAVGEKNEAGNLRATRGVVTFESRSFITSEKAVAAVFIVQRTHAERDTAVVKWAAYSGSADAGIDFSDASGTVRFADGQRQLAIYVPLRNDLLQESDETFKVCLRATQRARIGGASCAEVTILDDDHSLRT